MRDHRRERRLRRGHRMHRLDALDGEIDQHRAGEIEQREEIEIRGQPERVDDRGRHQPADQVAGDVAGDIGRERAAGVHRAALLAEIGQRQRERRRHAQALRDAQDREDGEVGRARQQRGRDREQDEAHENAEPPVDVRAEEADHEPGDRHAHGAGVDRKAHRRRGDVVMPGQRGQDRLRREQIDHGQERRQADDEGSQHHAGRMTVHFHRFAISSARRCRSWRSRCDA